MSNCCNTKISFPSDKFKDCCEVIFSNCIAYSGIEGCFDFGTYPNLNDVISAIINRICEAPVININAPCLISKGYAITDVTTFSAAVSDVICQILGCEVPAVGTQAGTITSLCELNSRLNTQTVISCFQPIAHLEAQASIEQLFSAIQSTLCLLVNAPAPSFTDQYVKNSATDTTSGYLSQKLQSGNTVTVTTVNAGANEYLKPEVKIDPASTVPWSVSPAGLLLNCCPVADPPRPTDAAINCSGIETSGTISSNSPITGVTIAVPYNCTVAGSYPSIVIPSNETINGTPVAYASVAAGSFITPNGVLTFNVTGNTTGFTGNSISFTLTVNGSACLVTIRMIINTVFTVPCDGSTWSLVANPLVIGTPVSATSGPPYLSFQINVSTLGTPNTVNIGTVTNDGLTITGISNYVLSTGVNTVHLMITGTPTATSISVPIAINGTVYCTFTLTASPAETPPGSYVLECTLCDGTTTLPAGTDGTAYSTTVNFCYESGVNGAVAALSVPGLWQGTSTASGLTMNIPAGTVTAPTGTLAGTITGVPTGSGTIVFNIPNTKCSFTITVRSPGGVVSVESTAQPTVDSINTQLIVSPSSSLTDTNNNDIVFDAAHFANYTSYPNYYIAGYRQLGYTSASLASVQPVSLAYSDSQAPVYGSYISGVDVDYINSAGEVISTQNYTPANFYNNANPYQVNGTTYYTNAMINLNIPANTTKVKMMIATP